MYSRFKWGDKSHGRLAIIRKFEPLQPFLMMALAAKSEARTFLDVGSNVGIYGILLGSMPEIQRVLAFEPSDETLKELRCNIALNNLGDKVSIYPNAVSSTSGTVAFGIIGSLSGANSVISTSIHDAEKIKAEVSVACVTLDEIALEDDGFPICMKIDVEGHELDALKGAKAMLSSRKVILQYESYTAVNREIDEFLECLGFAQITKIGPDHYVTNEPKFATPTFAVQAIETAVQLQIDDNRAPPVPAPNQPLRIRGPAGVAIELTGRSRNLIRRFLPSN